MNLRVRLALLMGLLTLLPALPAAWLARSLISRSLDLGLSAEVGDALDAGVRRAREGYLLRRAALSDSLDAWSVRLAGPEADAGALARAWAARPDPAGSPGACLLLRTSGGGTTVLKGDPEALAAPGSAAPDEPPHAVAAVRQLPGGGSLEARTPLPAGWIDDARLLAANLQAVRGLQSQREGLESGFWLPFVAIYLLALLAALGAAAWLNRGVTVPVRHLDAAAHAVAAGRWDVQVPPSGSGELRQLGERFNAMVRTLDVQSRRLVDLETMAGWREMARALAHEVKNPLTPIQLTVEEMRERYRGDDAEYAALLQECTRIVVNEVASLRNVVTRFREFSRPVEPCFAPLDLNALVSEIAALQRDLTVELDLDPAAGSLRADDDRLRQVLMNLCGNARRAVSGRPEPRLRLATRPDGDRVELVVEDNGPGIPPAERDRVFEPYRTGARGGLGLGLALVKGIVLAHGGGIAVEEGRWGGARFVISLPRDPETEGEA